MRASDTRIIAPDQMGVKAYRSLKRRELKAAKNSVTDLRCGSAFLPTEAYRKVVQAAELISSAREICLLSWRHADTRSRKHEA